MRLRSRLFSVDEWLHDSLFIAIGVAGVILVLLGLKRDDIVRPIFLVAGLGLAAFGFGVQLLGWSF